MRLALPVLLAAAAAAADPESARYFVSRAETARAEGKAAEAKQFLEKALKEQPEFLPAVVGLAGLAAEAGDSRQASSFLDLCFARRDRGGLSEEEKRAVEAAEALYLKIDRAGAEFRKIVDEHVARLAAIAEANRAAKPDVARAACRRILVLQPDHPKAAALLAALDGGKSGAATPLWNGRDLDGWTGSAPVWEVRGGVLCGRKPYGAAIARARRELGGEYTIECEMRIEEDFREEKDATPSVGVRFGIRGSYSHYGIEIGVADSFQLTQMTGENQVREILTRAHRRVLEDFSPTAWNRYRIAVRGGRVTISVNDAKVFEHEEKPGTFDGAAGIWLQNRAIEIRRFVVVP